MPWDIVTTDSESGSPTEAHHKRRLAELMREVWERLDVVASQWRMRGSKWIPCPFSIAMPKDAKQRKLTTPEEGIAKIYAATIEHARTQGAKEVRFEGLGMSTTAETALTLFKLTFRPFDDDDDDANADPKAKMHNVAIEATVVLRDLVKDLGGIIDKHHTREMGLLDKCIGMAQANTTTTEQFVLGLRASRKMQRDTMAHEEKMESERNNAAALDKLMNTLGGPLSQLLARFLAKNLNVDEATMTGSFAKRLTAIVEGVARSDGGAEKLAKMESLLGAEPWAILKAMSKAASDDAFRAAGERFIELVGGDLGEKVKRIAAVVGEGSMLAFAKLLNDASLL
jgi:hypothetical protein